MTTVEMVEKVTDWLNENVCPEITLKAPPEAGSAEDGEYQYNRVNPHAFPIYVPSKGRLPEGIENRVPSICVQLKNGKDTNDTRRDLTLTLFFVVWNPGAHEGDVINPDGSETFNQSNDGWKDLWLFMDKAISMIESKCDLNGVRINKEDPIEFSPYVPEGTVPENYPYWYAYATLKVSSGISTSISPSLLKSKVVAPLEKESSSTALSHITEKVFVLRLNL